MHVIGCIAVELSRAEVKRYQNMISVIGAARERLRLTQSVPV